ncbi:hypothetical protein HYFRA_00012580 [Hymenoscyphus fraxineus]|uniref:Uncharacterized protein n=1 Tax=Hymenoscyphus fraxineus TaxID=746836 RepID=A0A9N9L821_9HELO|nr:hypothetical protein HYFRA_00012580 [Hymenoscyphus fraxineus]
MAGKGGAGPTPIEDIPSIPAATPRSRYRPQMSDTIGKPLELCGNTIFGYKCGHKQASSDGITHSSDCPGVPLGEWFCANMNPSGNLVVQNDRVCPRCFFDQGFQLTAGHQQDLSTEKHPTQRNNIGVTDQQPKTGSFVKAENAPALPGQCHPGIPGSSNGCSSDVHQYPVANPYDSLHSYVAHKDLGRIDPTFHNFMTFRSAVASNANDENFLDMAGLYSHISNANPSGFPPAQVIYGHPHPEQVPVLNAFPTFPGDNQAGTKNYSRPFQFAPGQYIHGFNASALTNGEPFIVTSSSQQADLPPRITPPSNLEPLTKSNIPKFKVKLPPQTSVSPQAWFGRKGQPLDGKEGGMTFETPKQVESTSKEPEVLSQDIEASWVTVTRDLRQDRLKDYLKSHKLPTSLAHLYESVAFPGSRVLLKHGSVLDSALKQAGYQWPGTYSEEKDTTTSARDQNEKVSLVPLNSPQAAEIERPFPPRTSSLPTRTKEVRPSEGIFKPNNNTRQWSEQGRSRLQAASNHSGEKKLRAQAPEFQRFAETFPFEAMHHRQEQLLKELERSRQETSRNERILAREKFAEQLRNERLSRHTNDLQNSAAVKNVNTSNSKVLRPWRTTSNETGILNAPAVSDETPPVKITATNPSINTIPTPQHDATSFVYTTPRHGNTTLNLAERFPSFVPKSESVAAKVTSSIENSSREMALAGDGAAGERSHEEEVGDKDAESRSPKTGEDNEDDDWEMIPVEDEDI